MLLQGLTPERCRAGDVGLHPQPSLVVRDFCTHRIKRPLRRKSRIRHSRVALTDDLAIAKLPVKPALHGAESKLGMPKGNRLLGAPFRVELADLLDHDFATVGRKRMFRKPLRADENHSPGQQNRTAYAEGSALKNPREALLSLRRRGISKRQARQHEHPPS